MVNSDAVATPAELYRKGNESFVSEDYDRAIELYTQALAQDGSIVECYAAKAQALIKKEQFQDAKREADRGVDVLRGLGSMEDDKVKVEIIKCLQRSAVASFNLGRFKEAKNTYSEAQKVSPNDKGISQWITWCDEKIAKFGEDASKKADTQPSGATSSSTSGGTSSSTTDSQPSSSLSTASTAPAPAATTTQESSNQMPVPKIKHDWYQTETHVIIEVRIKQLKADDVKIDFSPTTLSVTAKLSTGSEYSLELDLAHPTTPQQSSYKILSTKLEIKLRKEEGVRWNSLEGDGTAPVPGGAPPPAPAAGSSKTPYASGRDWNRIEKALADEAEEKKEGEAALNEMFQKIYADANDDVRKAMNKSFSESGGTVLSTNWSEIGKDKVDVKPPDGMEFKKWE
eukprot:TRINITY_DN25111_c0_g1_i1.p1 TRINITY_DN25111_c0_g1~~TRINITY_DN25111_c0_g1_i1.p1  ORF type:complete len:399 (+),score=81.37 TRINITY_DN25111_c0_g1_i1:72-1268(+)